MLLPSHIVVSVASIPVGAPEVSLTVIIIVSASDVEPSSAINVMVLLPAIVQVTYPGSSMEEVSGSELSPKSQSHVDGSPVEPSVKFTESPRQITVLSAIISAFTALTWASTNLKGINIKNNIKTRRRYTFFICIFFLIQLLFGILYNHAFFSASY